VESLEKKVGRISYIRDIKGASTSRRMHEETTENFPMTIGLHQGLNPNHLSFYFSFGCTYETYPRVSTKMFSFYRWYNLTWRVEVGD